MIVETRRMNKGLTVSGGDEDVTMRTRWEKLGQVKRSVVGVIEQDKPFFAFRGKPDNGIVRDFAYLLPKSNVLQVGIDGLSCGGVNEEDIRETGCTGIFGLNTHEQIGIKHTGADGFLSDIVERTYKRSAFSLRHLGHAK